MREKFDLMWKYCYLMAERKRLCECLPRSYTFSEEYNETEELILEIEDYVMDIAFEYNMHYDCELNLFVEGAICEDFNKKKD